MATMRQYRNRWSALSNRLYSFFFSPSLFPYPLASQFLFFRYFLLFYFIFFRLDRYLESNRVLRGSLYTCIHVWICIWFEKSTFCNVVWLIVLNLVGRCIHFHFVCSFKWSDKKIISKIDDSGIVEYCW